MLTRCTAPCFKKDLLWRPVNKGLEFDCSIFECPIVFEWRKESEFTAIMFLAELNRNQSNELSPIDYAGILALKRLHDLSFFAYKLQS